MCGCWILGLVSNLLDNFMLYVLDHLLQGSSSKKLTVAIETNLLASVTKNMLGF
jgi:hypothetical protein